MGYEDLVDEGVSTPQEYFDGREFGIRASLEDSHYWHVHRRRVLARELRAYGVAKEARLMELGCGIGTVSTFLNQEGYHVDYSDIYQGALSVAQDRAELALGAGARDRRYVRMDITQPLACGSYRGFLLLDVIEHLPDDEGVMRNVAGALDDHPDAFTLVTVPAFQLLWSPWDDMEKHKRRYTKRQLTALLERCGFEVARTTYFFAPLFFAALGMKVLRGLRGEQPAAQDISDMTEAKNVASLNRVMLAALAPERAWLPTGSLPLGTSIMAIARRAR